MIPKAITAKGGAAAGHNWLQLGAVAGRSCDGDRPPIFAGLGAKGALFRCPELQKLRTREGQSWCSRSCECTKSFTAWGSSEAGVSEAASVGHAEKLAWRYSVTGQPIDAVRFRHRACEK